MSIIMRSQQNSPTFTMSKPWTSKHLLKMSLGLLLTTTTTMSVSTTVPASLRASIKAATQGQNTGQTVPSSAARRSTSANSRSVSVGRRNLGSGPSPRTPEVPPRVVPSLMKSTSSGSSTLRDRNSLPSDLRLNLGNLGKSTTSTMNKVNNKRSNSPTSPKSYTDRTHYQGPSNSLTSKLGQSMSYTPGLVSSSRNSTPLSSSRTCRSYTPGVIKRGPSIGSPIKTPEVRSLRGRHTHDREHVTNSVDNSTVSDDMFIHTDRSDRRKFESQSTSHAANNSMNKVLQESDVSNRGDTNSLRQRSLSYVPGPVVPRANTWVASSCLNAGNSNGIAPKSKTKEDDSYTSNKIIIQSDSTTQTADDQIHIDHSIDDLSNDAIEIEDLENSPKNAKSINNIINSTVSEITRCNDFESSKRPQTESKSESPRQLESTQSTESKSVWCIKNAAGQEDIKLTMFSALPFTVSKSTSKQDAETPRVRPSPDPQLERSESAKTTLLLNDSVFENTGNDLLNDTMSLSQSSKSTETSFIVREDSDIEDPVNNDELQGSSDTSLDSQDNLPLNTLLTLDHIDDYHSESDSDSSDAESQSGSPTNDNPNFQSYRVLPRWMSPPTPTATSSENNLLKKSPSIKSLKLPPAQATQSTGKKLLPVGTSYGFAPQVNNYKTVEKTINIFDWDEAVAPTNHMIVFFQQFWPIFVENLSEQIDASSMIELDCDCDVNNDDLLSNCSGESASEPITTEKEILLPLTEDDLILFSNKVRHDIAQAFSYDRQNKESFEKYCTFHNLDPLHYDFNRSQYEGDKRNGTFIHDTDTRVLKSVSDATPDSSDFSEVDDYIRNWKRSLDTTNDAIRMKTKDDPSARTVVISNGMWNGTILQIMQIQVILEVLYPEIITSKSSTGTQTQSQTESKTANSNIQERVEALNHLMTKLKSYKDSSENAGKDMVTLKREFARIFDVESCFSSDSLTDMSKTSSTSPSMLDIYANVPLYRTLIDDIPIITFHDIRTFWNSLRMNELADTQGVNISGGNQCHNGNAFTLLSSLKEAQIQSDNSDFIQKLFANHNDNLATLPKSSLKIYTRIFIKLIETYTYLNYANITDPDMIPYAAIIMLDVLENNKNLGDNQSSVKQFSTQIAVKQLLDEIRKEIDEDDANDDDVRIVLNLNSIGDNPFSEGQALKDLTLNDKDSSRFQSHTGHCSDDSLNGPTSKDNWYGNIILKKTFYRIPIRGIENWGLTNLWSNFIEVFGCHDVNHSMIKYLDPQLASNDFLETLSNIVAYHNEDIIDMTNGSSILNLAIKSLNVVLMLWSSCENYYYYNTIGDQNFLVELNGLQRHANRLMDSRVDTEPKIDILMEKVGGSESLRIETGIRYLMSYHVQNKHLLDENM